MKKPSLVFLFIVSLITFSIPSFSKDDQSFKHAANSLFEEYYGIKDVGPFSYSTDNYLEAFDYFNFWDALRVWGMRGDAEYKGPKKWDRKNVLIRIPAELLPNLKEIDVFLNDISHYTDLRFTIETYENDIDFSDLSNLNDKITIALLNDNYFRHGSSDSFLATATRDFVWPINLFSPHCTYWGLRCITGAAILSYKDSPYPVLNYLKGFTSDRYLHSLSRNKNLSGVTFFDGEDIEFSICEAPKALLTVNTDMQENYIRGCILKAIGLKAGLHIFMRQNLPDDVTGPMLTDTQFTENDFSAKLLPLHPLERLALKTLYGTQ